MVAVLMDMKFCLLFFLMAYVHQSKAFVTTQLYHVVISINIRTPRMAR
jgi:hypothetical protein